MTEQALKDLLDSMTLEEKAGQLVQCNAGQFIANEMEITGPDGELLPAEELNRVRTRSRRKRCRTSIWRPIRRRFRCC